MLKATSSIVYIAFVVIIPWPYVSPIIPRCHSTGYHHNLFTKELTVADWNKLWNGTCSKDLESYCRKNITISYFEMRPFTTNNDLDRETKSQGVLQKIIAMALAECCGNCLNITFHRAANKSELISITNKEKSDMLFPTFTQEISLSKHNIPIIHLSGAMFITRSSISAKLFAKEVVIAIIDIWPLLGVAILLAFAAGVLIWIIDTWWNKEHFPRRFVTGAFEGFWWAFVSMTTVGYGDKVPKSVFGRLFSVFWILTGMTICALMTAALTTAITAVAKRQQPTVKHGNVGILKDRGFEKSILMLGNAKDVQKDTLEQLITAIRDRQTTGMLLDTFTAKTLQPNVLIEENLYVDAIITDVEESFLGVTIYDQELYNLIQEYIGFHKDNIKDYVYEHFHSSLLEVQDETITANLIFTTDSGMFKPVIITGTVIVMLSLFIGGTYELYQLYKRKNRNEKREKFKVTLKTLQKEEERMTTELETLLKQWEKDLLSKMKTYSLQGIFTKSNTNYCNIVLRLSTKEDSQNSEIKDQADETDKSSSKTDGKEKTKKSKRSKLKRKNRVEPIASEEDDEYEDNGDEDDENVDEDDGHKQKNNKYIKLKEIKDHGYPSSSSPGVTKKVKKKRTRTRTTKNREEKKLKKVKIKAPQPSVDNEASEDEHDVNIPLEHGTVMKYGAANGATQNARRLPPLRKNIEDMV